ncbi:MAG: hypoxanthine phosphoribosyltransferase [Bacteroidia bacterium]|jgi:hypoxanthine phosphoribosyltransferase|nr:hypoxanthine phosphoribosyltransferase [Bacteroidia bacterium]
MSTITLHNKSFVPYIKEETILKRVKELAKQIESDYKQESPICLGVLTGGYVFIADLTRKINTPVQVVFVKMSSYSGTQSVGSIDWQLSVPDLVTNKHVLVIEDIIDTGLSMQHLLLALEVKKPKSVKIATLLYKPDALQYPIKPDYVGFSIPKAFVVGYGLDYDGLGRHLPELYVLQKEVEAGKA